MRQLFCPSCRDGTFFEQTQCARCDAQLVFDPGRLQLCCEDEARFCANRSLIGCNWAANRRERYCSSCALTRTIPPLQSARNIVLWRLVEEAKRRLLYDLARLDLPLRGKEGDKQVAFDILADDVGQPIMTGHLNGLMSIGSQIRPRIGFQFWL